MPSSEILQLCPRRLLHATQALARNLRSLHEMIREQGLAGCAELVKSVDERVGFDHDRCCRFCIGGVPFLYRWRRLGAGREGNFQSTISSPRDFRIGTSLLAMNTMECYLISAYRHVISSHDNL